MLEWAVPSVVSVGQVKVTFSTLVSVTVNSNEPLLSEVTPLAGLIFAWLPALAAIVTRLPLIAFPLASNNCTWTPPAVVPSAGTPEPSHTVMLAGMRRAVHQRPKASGGPAV